MRFEYIEELYLQNLNIENCSGQQKIGNDLVIDISAGISVSECTNVRIENVTISSSAGTGMIIHNSNAEVTITNSHFVKHGVDYSNANGGTGLCIIFTTYVARDTTAEHRQPSDHNSNSTYLIQDCTFRDNVAQANESINSYSHVHVDLRPGRGGGLCLYISGNSSDNTINITDSEFVKNEAHWGLGMYVRFQDSAFHNQIFVTNSNFSQNKCNSKDLSCGGGGVHVGFLQMAKLTLLTNNNFHPQNNAITFIGCTFENNTAIVGGGMTIRSSVFISSNFQEVNNTLHFIECTWTQNEAQFGSALDITTYEFNTYRAGFLPEPVFTDCLFTLNRIVDNCTRNSAPVTCRAGQGTVLITRFTLHFNKNISVIDNVGSGMVLVSSFVQFETNTQATFRNNTGFKGGAILLTGISALQVKSNTKLYFLDNKSATQGGAISYDSIYFHADMTSHKCFIHYTKDQRENNETKPTFVFSGNKAGSGENRLTGLTNGNTLYASTFNPCFRKCSSSPSNESTIEDLFNCLGIDVRNDTETISDRSTLSTCIGKLLFNMTGSLKAIPGRKVTIPIIALSDFEQPDVGIYHVSTNNSNVTVDQTSQYISDNKIQLYGKPGSKALVILNKPICRTLRAKIEVEMLECPPGYVSVPVSHSSNKSLVTCICGSSTNQSYKGILRCDENYQALAQHGYWVGYLENNYTEQNLATANCPQGYCWENNGERLSLHPLPNKPDGEELDKAVCGPNNRTGIVCGRCKDQHSVFYHSRNYKCGSNKLCHLGWLFYILSELLPTTLFFVIILTLDISFTSGIANGFIFFAQVIDSFATNINGFIIYSDGHQTIRDVIVASIYRVFNLDFFAIESMSFCLWKGANALDMIAFKFVTVAFALLLVAGTILILNKAHCCVRFIKPRTLRSSVIHGLSAFLVVCYAQTTRASLALILPVRLKHRNDTKEYIFGQNTYVFRGDMKYFRPEHLKYALPALFCLCTVVLVPPLLLITYPLFYKVLALCNLSENKHVNRITQLMFLEKMKPMLDSFQSCYKDNCRFFAGLYFCYRTIALITYAFSSNNALFFGILQCELLVILTLHCIAQPYKNKWYNIIDTLIFVNLSLINAMSIIAYSYSMSSRTKHTHAVINQVGAIQTLFISLPLICMALYITYRVIATARQYYRKKQARSESENEDDDLDEFPARMLEETDSFEGEYKSF